MAYRPRQHKPFRPTPKKSITLSKPAPPELDKYQKFYFTTKWRKTRGAYIKHHPLCVVCLKDEVSRAVQIVDHIIPIRDGGALYDWSNLQSLCYAHHNQKTADDKAKKKSVSDSSKPKIYLI